MTERVESRFLHDNNTPSCSCDSRSYCVPFVTELKHLRW